MTPLIISIFFGIILLIQITVLFRSRTIQKRAKAMVLLWLFNLPILIATCLYSYNQGIFPFDETLGGLKTNLLLCIFFYTAGFFGGILQVYNLADRGLSLRILIDLLFKPDGKTTTNEVLTKYSDGKGISWMYQKRINDMVDNNLIVVISDEVGLTPKGARLARIFQKLRTLYNF